MGLGRQKRAERQCVRVAEPRRRIRRLPDMGHDGKLHWLWPGLHVRAQGQAAVEPRTRHKTCLIEFPAACRGGRFFCGDEICRRAEFGLITRHGIPESSTLAMTRHTPASNAGTPSADSFVLAASR